MFKAFVVLVLIACVTSGPAPSGNIESLEKSPVESAASSLDNEKDDLEGSEFIWGWKFWPWYYPAKVVYPAPVAYKVVYPAPVVYKVSYPAPVVYKTIVEPAPIVYKAEPAFPVKEVNVSIQAQ